MPSNAWNLSTDYYDILPALSEMDAEDDRCEYCDGLINYDADYFIPSDELCTGDCQDDQDED